MYKKFFHNVLPSMLAFAFSGVYAIVDGWFVGRNIGDAGLAAINIAYPISAIVQALGTGIGMGGAILLSIAIGKSDEEGQKRYMGNALVMLLCASILFTSTFLFIYKPILVAFGAQGEVMELACQYILFMIGGAIFQMVGTGLLPIVRNYGGALVAMYAMIGGFVLNVVLDWLFMVVLGLGMNGAAAATLMGQAFTVLPSVYYMIVKKDVLHFAKFKPHFGCIKEIIKVGLSPFGLSLSPNIVIVILNKGALIYGGSLAVACYAVISYIVYVVQLLLQGVGDGSQPLISLYHGLGDEEAVHVIRKLSYWFSGAVAVLGMVVIIGFRGTLPLVFGVSKEAAQMSAKALPIFATGFVFAAILRISTSYFYAIKKNIYAYILIYGEPVVLAILIAFVFPRFMGINGVWAAVPVSQAALMFVSIILANRAKKKQEDLIQ